MLVGITGYARHGKDTAAQVLVDEYDYLRIGFADALKHMAAVLNPIVYRTSGLDDVRLAGLVETVGWDEAKKEPEVRRFLQVLGTEAVRDHLGENAWVDALDKAAEPVLYDCTERVWRYAGYEANPFDRFNGVVIPDVRFPNEEKYIRENDGLLLMVKRPDYDNGVGTNHPSESYIQDMNPDITITATNVPMLQDILRGVLRERLY